MLTTDNLLFIFDLIVTLTVFYWVYARYKN